MCSLLGLWRGCEGSRLWCRRRLTQTLATETLHRCHGAVPGRPAFWARTVAHRREHVCATRDLGTTGMLASHACLLYTRRDR
jgi:hypothetical protein